MMLPTRCLMRTGLNSLRINTTSCVVRNSIAPAFFLPRCRINVQRSITTGNTTGGLVAQRVQSATNSGKGNSRTISNVTPQSGDWMIEVKWGDGGSGRYPYIWLRDNCQCPDCFHVTSQNRRVQLRDLDISITPTSMKVNDAGNELEIIWSDGHKGLYPADWLQDRSFTEDKRAKRQQIHRFNRSYWGSDIIKQLPEANFNKLFQDDHALLEFLQKLEELGLVIVRDAPRRVGEIVKLSNHIGYLKQTHYGVTFAVKQKIDANNLAYTSDTLNLHVDLPYMYYKPGVQLLHCISQVSGEGGENHLVDSFHAAHQLRDLHPEKFQILATTLVDFDDQGTEDDGTAFHTHSQEPMIVLDRYGLVNTVNLNQMVRDSYFDVSVEKVRDWYDAMLTYSDLLYHPDNLITYKLNEGEIAVFDNNRVMHGRRGYNMTQGTRELEGCYWDWDMVKSCRRILKKKLGIAQ